MTGPERPTAGRKRPADAAHRVVTDGDSGIPDDRFRHEPARLVVGYPTTPA